MPPPCGLGKVSKKGIPPSAFGCSMVNFMCGSMESVELNFLVSFNTDDQSKTDVANAINVITYKSKSSR